MKKINDNVLSWISIFLITFISCGILILGFCIFMKMDKSIRDEQRVEASEDKIFVPIENDYYFYIAYDKETMVEYVISSASTSGGPVIITPLINADGTPKLYEGD